MTKDRPILNTAEAVLTQLKFIRSKKQEYFVCLSLDSNNRPIARRVVSIGTLTATLTHPREIFAGPLKDRAAYIIIAHNHPSGVVEPSGEDVKTTQQLVAAGILLGISINDHLIVSRTNYYSFKKHRLL